KILEIQPVQAGEVHIKHQASDRRGDFLQQKFLGGRERFNTVPSQLEQAFKSPTDGMIIVHHKHRWSFTNHRLPFPKTGRTTLNVTPFSALFATEILPPWTSTIERQMDRPIPRP